jgi:phytoene dehydrogenase-like protein
MPSSPRKIVIIGAGIAGLCAAVYARRCGYEVEVLEKHGLAGGLATSWRRGDYTFETCLHWLLGSRPGGALHAQWKEVFDIDALSFVNQEEYARIEGPRGESLVLFANVERMEAELLKGAPKDEEEVRRLASAVRRLSKLEIPDPGLHWPRTWISLFRALPELPVLMKFNRMSMRDYAKRFSDPLLAALLSGGETGNLSSLAFVLSLAWMNDKNAGYPIGGSQAVIQAIAGTFGMLGGRLRLGVEVEEILVKDAAAVGVRLAGGETIAADWVVSAADGHATIYELSAIRRATKRRNGASPTRSLRFSTSASQASARRSKSPTSPRRRVSFAILATGKGAWKVGFWRPVWASSSCTTRCRDSSVS